MEKNKEKVVTEFIAKPLPHEKIKINIDYKKKQLNGLALLEKIKETTKLNQDLITSLDKEQDKAVIIDLIKVQSEIITNYQKDSINRDKWNKFFIMFRSLIILGTIFIIGLLVVLMLYSSGVFVLDDMIVKLLAGTFGGLTGLLSLAFVGVFSYLGLKKDK